MSTGEIFTKSKLSALTVAINCKQKLLKTLYLIVDRMISFLFLHYNRVTPVAHGYQLTEIYGNSEILILNCITGYMKRGFCILTLPIIFITKSKLVYQYGFETNQYPLDWNQFSIILKNHV